MPYLRAFLWLPVILALVGCSRGRSAGIAPFTVLRSTPALPGGGTTVMLNDALTVYFSAPIDPNSVTQDTFSVLDSNGHQVQGSLRVAAQHVTFEPEPPVTAELLDGSFQPGREYRLVVAGYPRPDAIRTRDGVRLAAVFSRPFRAEADGAAAPLRPLGNGLPFLLKVTELSGQIPVDNPRVRLRFSLPVAPRSVRADAFVVSLVRDQPREMRVVPRSVRVVAPRPAGDEFAGCTVEIDLGGELRLRGTEELVALRPHDYVMVQLAGGPAAILDYGGNPVQMPALATAQYWQVVEGATVTWLEWPPPDAEIAADDPLLPTFEVVGGGVRARVRTEAGDGSLGILRPRRDLTLRAGVPFDRGDGTFVTSRGSHFPFLAIDIPEGVTVTLVETAPGVRLLACGGVRVAGNLVLDTPSVPAHVQALREVDAASLLAAAPAALVAAGQIEVAGAIRALRDVAPDQTALTVVSATGCRLRGPVPDGTLVAVEPQHPLVWEAPQRKVTATTRLTPGVPEGCEIECTGNSSWLTLRAGCDGGVFVLEGVDPRTEVGWQLAPPDPIRTGLPDPRVERWAQVRALGNGEAVVVQSGHHFRFCLRGRVRSGQALPRVGSIRLRGR